VRFTIEDVQSVCVCIFYTVCGDRIKYNFLFGKQAGWGVWNSCEKISLSEPSVMLYLPLCTWRLPHLCVIP